MNIIKFLLDPRGRLRRRQFWFAWLVVLVLGVGISQAKEQSSTLFGMVIGIYLTITIYGKRLHDLGQSAWKLGWPFVLTGIALGASVWMAYSFMSNPMQFGMDNLGNLYTFLAIANFAPYVVWVVYAVMVGIPKGEDGDNRFGPDPRVQQAIADNPGSQA